MITDTKLLFLDIDGTLINSDKEITPRTKAAVTRAREEHGVEVVLISARPPQSLVHICGMLDIPVNVVAFNGSIARLSMLPDAVVELPASQLLDKDLVIGCHKLAQPYEDMSINIYTDSQWLTNDSANRWTQREINNTMVRPEVTDLNSGNIASYLHDLQVHKVLLRSNPANVELLAGELVAVGLDSQANTTNTRNKLIELTPHGVDKGKAVHKISRLTGINVSQMMAFGDADNDVEMLQAVGLGYAMADCNDKLRAVATEVVGSNNEEGVAAKLEELHNDVVKN